MMTSLLSPLYQVGCGLILSLVRMSDMPTTAYYTSSRQYISRVLEEAAAQQHKPILVPLIANVRPLVRDAT